MWGKPEILYDERYRNWYEDVKGGLATKPGAPKEVVEAVDRYNAMIKDLKKPQVKYDDKGNIIRFCRIAE